MDLHSLQKLLVSYKLSEFAISTFIHSRSWFVMKYIPSITHTYGKILIGAADIYYNSHKMGSSDFILLYKSLKQGLFLLFYLVSFVNLKNYVS